MTSSSRKDIECEIACNSTTLFAVAKETKTRVLLVSCLQSQLSSGLDVEPLEIPAFRKNLGRKRRSDLLQKLILQSLTPALSYSAMR